MDDRFKNLIRRRDYKLAIVAFAILGSIMLLANRFAYPLLESPQTKLQIHLSFAVIGIMVGEIALLAAWVALSSQTLWKRIQFLFVCSLLLIAAWLLGYLSTFDSDVGINWRNREPIFYLGWLPLVFLATALPLIILRFFTSLVLAPYDSLTPPTRQRVTTMSLLLTTTLVAFVLATIQLPAMIGNAQSDNWAASGGFAGVFFLIGLLIVLPSVLVLCSSRLNFLIWSVATLTAGVLMATGAMYLLISITRSQWRPNDEMLIPAQVSAAGMACFLLGIFVIRLSGYRLQKAQIQSANLSKP